MRIAFVTPMYYPAKLGGTALGVQELAEEMARRGHDCTVFCFNGCEAHWLFPLLCRKFDQARQSVHGVTVERMRAAWPLTAGAHLLTFAFDKLHGPNLWPAVRLAAYGPWLIGLDAALARWKGDVVHIEPFPYFLSWQAARVCLRHSVPYVLKPAFHETAEGFANPLLVSAARNAAYVTTSTRSEADTMIRLGVPAERLVVQAVGIPLAQAPGEREPSFAGSVVVLFAGARSVGKGAPALLAAARRLESRKNILFLAIGPDTPEWRTVARRGLPGNFRDLGFVSEEMKQRLFASCDIFAMPSKDESFGRVYAEAWQYGKPVIGCDIPPMREIIEHGGDGILVPFGDSLALMRAIESLAGDPALRERMGRAGRLKTFARFNQRLFHDVMEATFGKAVARRVRARSSGRSGP